jgi:hypothetical protein
MDSIGWLKVKKRVENANVKRVIFGQTLLIPNGTYLARKTKPGGKPGFQNSEFLRK